MRQEGRHSAAPLFGLATQAFADRFLKKNRLAATNLRNFPEAQHRNFRVPLSPLALLILWGMGVASCHRRYPVWFPQETGAFAIC
jgi:hypothetical protein